ncbi:MAG: hemerythrin [Deltaproteobacteria bacterium]|nr:hemerythrin [Deltaproteobacteria bacterium]
MIPEIVPPTTASQDAISLLVDEHRLIVQMLYALKDFTTGIRQSQPEEMTSEDLAAEKEKLAAFVEFFRTFADAHHHAKEEDILFRIMVENGFSTDMGPIAVMLHEHEVGRNWVGQLEQASKEKNAWTGDERKTIAAAAVSFVDLLEAHIQKEDEILYPMARSNLSQEAMKTVDEEVKVFQKAAGTNGEQKRLLDLATSLLEGA